MIFFQLKNSFRNRFLLLLNRTVSQQHVFQMKRFIHQKKLKTKIFAKYYVLHRNFGVFFNLMKDKKDKVLDDENEMHLHDPYFVNVTNRLYRQPGMPHNLLVIQPRLKVGPNREKIERSELKLAEAVALVHTLPQWKVIQKHIISVVNLDSKFIFTSGNLEKIKAMVSTDLKISAVFVGIDIMTSLQNSSLEQHLNVPVFDRYQVILQIFHDHAHTREAKLQLALAEIPYLRVKLCMFSHTRDSTNFSGIQHVGGYGETYTEKRRRLLNEREVKLKKELQKIKNQRDLLRNNKGRSALPVIAVVGYTNCGKTTLIKTLTNDSRLLPEDKLFATLDVTFHAGLFPSNQKVLFIDTVGFISDVPTALIESFKSTLEEISLADLVIHVRDISHPDTEHQKKIVKNTLEELDLPQKLLDSVLEVRNKADLLESLPTDTSEALYISATEGMGLLQMMQVAEEKLFKNTGHCVSLIRIPNGGQEYTWLRKVGGIRDYIVDSEDSNYLIIEVILSSANLAKFKDYFGDLTISVDDIKM